jgi:hypothetical protein
MTVIGKSLAIKCESSITYIDVNSDLTARFQYPILAGSTAQ